MNNLHRTLQRYFGYTEFRPLQEEIITGILNGENAFVLMPTGGGKSLCYQLPALLLPGLTVVVSPLIALMKDQVDALRSAGIHAAFINSSLRRDEIEEIKALVLKGTVNILYMAPERLLLEDTLQFLDAANLSLIAVDEAHCISEWGHDFREDYRNLSLLRNRYRQVPVIAMTATANERVRQDILRQLDLESTAKVYVASFDRPNLHISVKPKSGLGQITDVIERFPNESGIIYCMSRAKTEELAKRLSDQGYSAAPYHAGLRPEIRIKNQEMFERDEIDIVCATIAFGMGIDKPDVRFVIHYDLPKNIMSYYQEIGRAGRDGLPSECLLLYKRGDRGKILHFISLMTDPLEQRVAYSNLDTMTSYAESIECRRRILLRGFGENYEKETCDNCDNCLQRDEREEVDVTEMAQMLLSCVVRLNERFGIAYTIDVLRGSEAKKILSNRHHNLSTWGVGKQHSKKEWQWLSQSLIAGGFIHQRVEQFNTVGVTERGWNVLQKKERIKLSRTYRPEEEEPKSRRSIGKEVDNAPLFERLRSLRKSIANDQGVPPYIVFGDNTLREMASTMPRNDQELLKVTGVGETKLQRYGKAFLEIIERYRRENIRDEHSTISESAEISTEMFVKGFSVDQIAERRGLAQSSVEGHLADAIHHGLIETIDELVSPVKAEKIREAFKRHGTERLRPAMEELGEAEFRWFELRVVRAFDNWKRKEVGDGAKLV